MSLDLRLGAEMAVAEAQALIQNAMTDAGLSRSALAHRLGRQRSFVTRLLKSGANPTVRTLGRVLAACGQVPDLRSEPDEFGMFDSANLERAARPQGLSPKEPT